MLKNNPQTGGRKPPGTCRADFQSFLKAVPKEWVLTPLVDFQSSPEVLSQVSAHFLLQTEDLSIPWQAILVSQGTVRGFREEEKSHLSYLSWHFARERVMERVIKAGNIAIFIENGNVPGQWRILTPEVLSTNLQKGVKTGIPWSQLEIPSWECR